MKDFVDVKKEFKNIILSIWKSFNLFFEDTKRRDKVFKSTFNSEIGTYEINLNTKKAPILFNVMLYGQRALDLVSLERLKW